MVLTPSEPRLCNPTGQPGRRVQRVRGHGVVVHVHRLQPRAARHRRHAAAQACDTHTHTQSSTVPLQAGCCVLRLQRLRFGVTPLRRLNDRSSTRSSGLPASGATAVSRFSDTCRLSRCGSPARHGSQVSWLRFSHSRRKSGSRSPALGASAASDSAANRLPLPGFNSKSNLDSIKQNLD
jgi:hypothetical protein